MKKLYKKVYKELRGLLINPPKEEVKLASIPWEAIEVEVEENGENGVIYWGEKFLILPFHFGNLKQVASRLTTEVLLELKE